LRNAVTVAGTGATYHSIQQKIEDVRTFAGQTITVSFWAKAEASRSITFGVYQNFGSGGSSTVFPTGGTATVSTSWARYSATISVPSISGKTIGTNSFLAFAIDCPLNAISTTDIWGVQVEAGSVATPFQTATGTIQGELAACQRYYYRETPQSGGPFGFGWAFNTVGGVAIVDFPVTMRIAPTALEQSGTASHYEIAYQAAGAVCNAVPIFNNGTNKKTIVTISVASGFTAGIGLNLRSNNASAYLGWSAEL
jgi:hypothetical protein